MHIGNFEGRITGECAQAVELVLAGSVTNVLKSLTLSILFTMEDLCNDESLCLFIRRMINFLSTYRDTSLLPTLCYPILFSRA